MLNHIVLAPQAPNPMGSMLPMLLIFVVLFFFMIWPQMRKQKKAKQYLSELKKGDNIVTTGGIHAKIASVGETIFILETEEGKMKAEKGAVSMEMTMAAYPKAKSE
jgi:preprotein translocase subunit YajC